MKHIKLITAASLLLVLVTAGIYVKKTHKLQAPSPQNTPAVQAQSPQIVSTNPDPLENSIVTATDPVEITFNKPLQNIGEFKIRIEPKIEFKIELSSDRKTGRVIPIKPLELGVTYTLFIGPETKFDGMGNWGQEKIYHFKTVKYTGV